MKRTQIQLPDALYEKAHNLADKKEISLAELVRRGLEYMLAVSPGKHLAGDDWMLPDALTLNADNPFTDENWREELHTGRLLAAEERKSYGRKKDR